MRQGREKERRGGNEAIRGKGDGSSMSAQEKYQTGHRRRDGYMGPGGAHSDDAGKAARGLTSD